MTDQLRPQALPGLEAEINPLDEAQLRSQEAQQLFEAQYGDAPWMDDYFELRSEGWDWRKAMYIIWASVPADRREPRTQKDLATALGLTTDRVIREWRAKNPAIQTRIDALVRASLGKARAKIYQALIESASNPSHRASADRKLALEMMGDYTPKQSLTVGTQAEPEELGAADLAAQAQIPEAGE